MPIKAERTEVKEEQYTRLRFFRVSIWKGNCVRGCARATGGVDTLCTSLYIYIVEIGVASREWTSPPRGTHPGHGTTIAGLHGYIAL